MSSDCLLALNELSVAAGGVRLIERLSLELRAGEIATLSGPSGCGKSTLLRTIVGLIDPAGGSLRFDGREPHTLGWPALRRSVLYVQQRPALRDESVEENLRHAFRYAASSSEFSREQAAEWLARLGLNGKVLSQDARSLSVGEQQRVCLVRGLLVLPRVILLDEPTSGLDEASAQAVERLIDEQARERGLAALVVVHDRGRFADARRIDLAPYLCRATPGSNRSRESTGGAHAAD